MLAHTCNPSTWETEAGGSYHEFKANQTWKTLVQKGERDRLIKKICDIGLQQILSNLDFALVLRQNSGHSTQYSIHWEFAHKGRWKHKLFLALYELLLL